MKRISFFYLIAVLLFWLFLAGCNSQTAPTRAQQPGEASTTARPQPTQTFLPNTPPWGNDPTATATPFSNLGVNKADLQGQAIRFWYVGSPSDEIGLMVDTFNSTNAWGIKVTAQAFAGYGELAETLDSTRQQDQLPDLLTGYNYQAARWDSEGRKLLDLADYVDDPIWGLTDEEKADFYPVFWWQDVDARSRKRYGVPFHRDGLVLFYNTTWAKELGFSKPPTTAREFERQACAAAAANNKDQRAENNGTGGWIISSDPSTLTAWLLAFEASLLDPNGRYAFSSPEASQALAFLKKLGDDGCAWQSAYAQPNLEFAERKALFITATTGAIAGQLQAMWETENADVWQVISYPGASSESVVVVRGPGLNVLQSTPVRQLAAWLFARWLISPESQARRIAAEGGYPTRVSTLEQLRSYARANPQWEQAVSLVFDARSEPSDASWAMVRWTLSDAIEQLYAPGFAAEDISEVLKRLDQLAVEASVQYR
ncbi:MAG: extracellular solute-binding protein [Chloroflexota bacterium]